MGVAMQGVSKISRAPIIKIIGYRAHRAVIFAIAWHLVDISKCICHVKRPEQSPYFYPWARGIIWSNSGEVGQSKKEWNQKSIEQQLPLQLQAHYAIAVTLNNIVD